MKITYRVYYTRINSGPLQVTTETISDGALEALLIEHFNSDCSPNMRAKEVTIEGVEL